MAILFFSMGILIHLSGRDGLYIERGPGLIKGLITVGRELQQQHPSDLLCGAGTSRELRQTTNFTVMNTGTSSGTSSGM